MPRRLLFAIVVSVLLICIMPKDADVSTSPETPKPTAIITSLVVPEPTISFSAIRHITCGKGTGTGSIIKKDMVLTASHVVGENVTCEDSMTGAIGEVIINESDTDYAVLKFPVGSLPDRRIRLSCEGFKEGETYYSYGWMLGMEFVAQRLFYNGITAPLIFTREGGMYRNLKMIEGVIIPGMSGGPIVNSSGVMIGTNQVTDWDGVINYGHVGASRAISDSFFCEKPKPPVK